MAGMEVTRQSSFEKMMNLVTAVDESCHQLGSSDTDRKKAAYELQLWWSKERKIIQTKKDILNSRPQVLLITESIDSVRKSLGDFGAVQKILSSSSFISSLNDFLSILPLDPSLKAKNSTARSSHTIGSAFFIHYFRSEVLLDDDAIDQSREADECAIAAEMLIGTFNRFIKNCMLLTPTTGTTTLSNAQFKKSMLRYRFSVRYFIEKLEQWKGLDASRLLQSLEAPYTESYVIFLNLSRVLKGDSSKVTVEGGDINGNVIVDSSMEEKMIMLRSAEQQCLRIKQAMVKLLGPRAQTRIEELNAQIEAALNNSVGSDEGPEAILLTAASRVLTAVDGTNIQHIETVTSLPSSPLPNSPRQGDASATNLPKEFSHIGILLKRIAATGGISPPNAGFEPDASQEFQVGDDRHQLIHELCLNPSYKLAESRDPAGIDLTFYSRYYLLSPPDTNIEKAGWSHMVQSPLYPRSPLMLLPSEPQLQGTEEAMDQVKISMRQLEQKIKSSLLFMMDDNIVCSLSRSNIKEHDIEEMSVGMIIPLRYSNGQTDPMVLSSRVLAVNREESAFIPSDTEGEQRKGRILSVNVECLSDSSIEKNVPLNRVKISTDPPEPTPFLLALQDTLNRVAGLTPHRSDLHAELSAAVDFPMWMQMIVHSAMTVSDVSRIFSHIFACISKLQAPIRSESFTQWTNDYLRLISASSSFESLVPLLPLVFEFTSSCIDEIKRDMANFHVATLSRIVQGTIGVQFLSHFILKDIMATDGRGRSCLDSTVSLLVFLLAPTAKRAELVAEILEATGQEVDLDTLYMDERVFQAEHGVAAATSVRSSSSSSGSGGGTHNPRVSARTSVIAVTMLRLLQFPYRLGGPSANARMLPETFVFDGQRLSHLRDLVDIISVQCTVMITIRQALQKIGLLSTEAEEAVLYGRLNILLRDPTVGMKSIVTEAVRFVRTSIENAKVHVAPQGNLLSPNSPRAPLALATLNGPSPIASGAPLSPRPLAASFSDLEQALEKSLRNVLAEGNPVLALFTKRVYKVLLRAILNQPYAVKLPSYSLHAKGIQKNLGDLIARAVKLFDVHLAEYGDVYATIFYHPTVQNFIFPIDVEVD